MKLPVMFVIFLLCYEITLVSSGRRKLKSRVKALEAKVEELSNGYTSNSAAIEVCKHDVQNLQGRIEQIEAGKLNQKTRS